jgi:hypothetical protein
MNKWINRIIKPHMRGLEDAFLLVDHYKVHMMGSFVNACNNLGVDVDYLTAVDFINDLANQVSFWSLENAGRFLHQATARNGMQEDALCIE